MTRKTIIICIPCLSLGGSEIATLSFAKALPADRYAVTVCCYHESDAAMVDRFRQAQIEVDLLGLSRGGLPALGSLFRTLVGYFRMRKPDVVHVQYLAPGMIPILAARWAGVPHVLATVHTAGPKGYGLKARWMLRLSARLTDHFFCVSQNAERFWFGAASPGLEAGSGNTRHSTIYNGVDTEAIRAAGRNLQRESLCPELPPGAKVVGIVGRLVRLKGHLTLIEAMAEIVPQMPEAYLLVIGRGADEVQFRREAQRRHVASHVVWKGAVEPETLPQYYHLIDVLAMPSHWEGFGLAAAEAMAAGKPVVGTAVPGLQEVVEDQVTGFLVPVDDARTLAGRLRVLLSDGQLAHQMGSSGLHRARRVFDVTHHRDRWAKAYQALLAG